MNPALGPAHPPVSEQQTDVAPLGLAEGVVARVPLVAVVTLALEVAHLVDTDVTAHPGVLTFVNI